MSGFAGVVHADGALPDQSLLQAMSERLAFRGPDGSQIWRRAGAGFCFAFSRTGPAPQGSTQPVSIDDRTWLLGDVRLDGREELLRRLSLDAIEKTSSITDEELLLHVWRKWGEAGLGEFFGDYSFVVWDSISRSLLAARDLIGIRPFFYGHMGASLYFSNTLEALGTVPGISTELDENFIADFLLQGWSLDPQNTVFRAIRRLPPGHTLSFAKGVAQLQRHSELPVEEPLRRKRPDEYLEELDSLLLESVKDRLPASRAAVFMSGGLDSTSVAAYAAQVAKAGSHSVEMHAYTADFRPLFEDEEAHFASQVAQHLNIPHTVFSDGDALPFEDWKEPTFCTPEPCVEPYLLPSLRLYRKVAVFARVVLSGDGGDDILTGETWPYLKFLVRQRRFLTLASSFGGYLLKHGRLPPLRAGIRTRLLRWTGREEAVSGYPEWLEPAFEKKQHLRERWESLGRTPAAVHPVHPGAYATLSGTFWASVMEDEDAAWTGVPVERRAPFLDLRVIRFLLRLPAVPFCIQKAVLREVLKGKLPEEVRRRPKTPLAQDPFALHVERGWSPLPLPPPVESVRHYVQWEKLTATSSAFRGSSLWGVVRPVSLNHWLKGVEKKNRIQ